MYYYAMGVSQINAIYMIIRGFNLALANYISIKYKHNERFFKGMSVLQ